MGKVIFNTSGEIPHLLGGNDTDTSIEAGAIKKRDAIHATGIKSTAIFRGTAIFRDTSTSILKETESSYSSSRIALGGVEYHQT
jgi:hypothetical protein